MKVQRVVANMKVPDPSLAQKFYGQILGLDLLMDMNWIRTYGSNLKMSVQVSFMREGGAGTPVPDISIEVDDVDAALDGFKKEGFAIEYGPATRVRQFRCKNVGFRRAPQALAWLSGRLRRNLCGGTLSMLLHWRFHC